jgi:hypothetical protein
VAAGFSPLDEELALPAGHLSSFVHEAVLRLATWMPFGRAVAEVAWFTGVTVSETTVRRLTEGAGRTYAAEQTAEAAVLERETPPAPPGPAVQALSVDGAMVPLVGGTWVEVKTVALGTVEVLPAGRPDRPRQEVATTDLSYFSRMADHETFTRLALVETQRRGTETAGMVCAVGDGAVWIQGFVDHHRPDAVRILDWPHAIGYVAAVAAAVYGTDSPAAKAWLAGQKETLLHGDPALLLTDLAQLQADLTAVADGSRARLVWTLPGPHAADPPLHGVLGREDARYAAAVVADSLHYLQARQAQIQYAAFRAAHYPIGSGSVESANKLLVEARLKGAGRRWAPASVNPMVALRTVACNDRWAEAVPRIGAAQRRERQAATTQRRAARQAVRERQAVEQARLATAATSPSALPATPATPPPPVTPSVRRHSRTPAPDHPWRHATLRHQRSA